MLLEKSMLIIMNRYNTTELFIHQCDQVEITSEYIYRVRIFVLELVAEIMENYAHFSGTLQYHRTSITTI